MKISKNEDNNVMYVSGVCGKGKRGMEENIIEQQLKHFFLCFSFKIALSGLVVEREL